MAYSCIRVERTGAATTITMNLPERRNALGQAHLSELLVAFGDAAASDATGVILAGNGPVFSAGHDLAEMAGQDLVTMRRLLGTCTELMLLIGRMPQVVIARVHGLATAAGCQLVAAADLAVAAESARFAVPGGRGDGSAPRRWWPSVGRCHGSGPSSWRCAVIRSMRPLPRRGAW